MIETGDGLKKFDMLILAAVYSGIEEDNSLMSKLLISCFSPSREARLEWAVWMVPVGIYYIVLVECVGTGVSVTD